MSKVYSHETFVEDLKVAVDLLKETVIKKNLAYGNSYEVAPQIMKVLYPDGIKPEQMDNALLMVRVIDKIKRIVQNNDPFGENPWMDIAGYAVLAMTTQEKKNV